MDELKLLIDMVANLPTLLPSNVEFSGTAKRSFDGSAGTQG